MIASGAKLTAAITQGFKYVFRFVPNDYFENKEIFKQFKYTKETG